MLESTIRERALRRVKAAVRKLLPDTVMRKVYRSRAYEGTRRLLYLKTRAFTGMENSKLRRVPQTARSFVFVCYGNIMRSPMCEALMKQALAGMPEVRITSAGLNAAPGRQAHTWAIEAARDFGIALEDHHARLLTDAMVEQADVVFAMDYENQSQLLSRFAGAKDKALMLGTYGQQGRGAVEIRDPYYMGLEGTRQCYQILDACIRNLVHDLALGSTISG